MTSPETKICPAMFTNAKNEISNKMYDEKLEKALNLDFQPRQQEQTGPVLERKLTPTKNK